MGINVNGMSPTEAKQYWYDYNNGNTKGLSEAEYQSILSKFRSYIDNWENDVDENGYTQSPEERLEFDSDDAGFFGDTQDGVQGVATGAVAVAGIAGNAIAKFTPGGTAGMGLNFSVKGQYVNGLLLIVAGMQFAQAMWTKANTPNKEAKEACETAQDELYTEQANLADQILTMEEMQEEMELLQEEALAVNEAGQSDIVDMEGMYNYYYTKYQNGTATDREIALMKALGAQMQSTQSATNEETVGLNEEIVKVGDGYENVSASIDTTNQFADYVADIDEATQSATKAQKILLAISAASAAVTAVQCAVRGASLALFGAGGVYFAAAAMAGIAATIFSTQSANQGDFNEIASETIDIRQNTQDLSAQTTEFQEVSTEFWEETVDVTSEENLFTLTPTYATTSATVPASAPAEDEAAEGGKETAAAGSNTFNPFGVSDTDEEPVSSGGNPFIKDKEE